LLNHYIRPEYKEHVSPVLTTVFVIESAFNYNVAFSVVLVIVFFSPFITYHRVCNKSNTTGATNAAGTAYPSRASEFTRCF
jgi:hypothetical protein